MVREFADAVVGAGVRGTRPVLPFLMFHEGEWMNEFSEHRDLRVSSCSASIDREVVRFADVTSCDIPFWEQNGMSQSCRDECVMAEAWGRERDGLWILQARVCKGRSSPPRWRAVLRKCLRWLG